MLATAQLEIAQAAAAWVLEHGLDQGSAKRKARDELGFSPRTPLPDGSAMDAALREHIALFLADSQPAELKALRALALRWMARLSAFRPHLGGAVWAGTATLHTPITLQLYADDAKMVDIEILNAGVDYHVGEVLGVAGQNVPCLSITATLPEFSTHAVVDLWVHDAADLARAKKMDGLGRPLRGNASALKALLA